MRSKKTLKQVDSWDLVAKDYDQLVGETGDVYHRTYLNPVVLKMLGEVEGERVLDLACGQGYFSRLLQKKGAEVVGVDLSGKLIAIARQRNKGLKKPIEYFVSDASKLPFLEDSSFDLVVSNMSFHDIKGIEGTVEECSRVLKKDGKLVFSIPHPLRDEAERLEEKERISLIVHRYRSLTEVPNLLFKDKPVAKYHRPIGYYLERLLENGFLITSFKEICTQHRQGKLVQDQKILRYKQEFPTFLVVGAIKV